MFTSAPIALTIRDMKTGFYGMVAAFDCISDCRAVRYSRLVGIIPQPSNNPLSFETSGIRLGDWLRHRAVVFDGALLRVSALRASIAIAAVGDWPHKVIHLAKGGYFAPAAL